MSHAERLKSLLETAALSVAQLRLQPPARFDCQLQAKLIEAEAMVNAFAVLYATELQKLEDKRRREEIYSTREPDDDDQF